MCWSGLPRASVISAIATELPYLPRRGATGAEALELLFVFESVHAGPETIVGVTDQLLLRDQSVKWLNHQFLFRPDIFENLPFEDEKPTIDPDVPVVDAVNFGN